MIRLRTFQTLTFLGVALLFVLTLPAHAQGCAQCLDTTRSTPPSVQAAYRHAILLLGGSAATLFITGGILLFRRQHESIYAPESPTIRVPTSPLAVRGEVCDGTTYAPTLPHPQPPPAAMHPRPAPPAFPAT